jgi:putative transposase
VAMPNPGPPVGIDRGVVHTLALSDGRALDMPSLLTPGEQRRLLGLERKAARQQLARKQSRNPSKPKPPMSSRHRRTAAQIAALRAREARRREDWLRRGTTDLANSHSLIVMEDLRIANTTRSAHGTITSAPCRAGRWSGSSRATPQSNAQGAATSPRRTGSAKPPLAVWPAVT